MPHEMFVVKLSKSFILLCLPNSITLNTTFPAKIFDKQPLKKVLPKSVIYCLDDITFFVKMGAVKRKGVKS